MADFLQFKDLQPGRDYVCIQRRVGGQECRAVECSVVEVQFEVGMTKIAYGIWTNPNDWTTLGYQEKLEVK